MPSKRRPPKEKEGGKQMKGKRLNGGIIQVEKKKNLQRTKKKFREKTYVYSPAVVGRRGGESGGKFEECHK